MNFHLFTIIIIYTFLILIGHIFLKNNRKSNYYSKNNNRYENTNIEPNVENESETVFVESEESSEKNDNKLLQINDYDESNVRSELLKYLDDENTDINNEKQNILNKYIDNDVKESNSFNKLSVNDFKDENLEIAKHFKSDNNEVYTFDPVPTKKTEFNMIKKDDVNLSKKKLFGDVVAYDDFDDNYASFEK